jgi:hypothetical protein
MAPDYQSYEQNGTEVNPGGGLLSQLPINAFLVWRDGVPEVYQYPRGFERPDIPIREEEEDGFLYVDGYSSEFPDVASPTEGATVDGAVLNYPEREGRTFSLTFLPPRSADDPYLAPSYYARQNFGKALKHCIGRGGRLPTIRELYDFCHAPSNSESPSAEEWCYGQSSQGEVRVWSGTANASDPSTIWSVGGGTASGWLKHFEYAAAVCVEESARWDW